MEHKFDWALVDLQCDVEHGKIVKGRVFSDCLVPTFIDALNDEIATGELTYDVDGVNQLCDRVLAKFTDDSSAEAIRSTYIPELRQWLSESI